jgi:hypothetical protein
MYWNIAGDSDGCVDHRRRKVDQSTPNEDTNHCRHRHHTRWHVAAGIPHQLFRNAGRDDDLLECRSHQLVDNSAVRIQNHWYVVESLLHDGSANG